MADEEVGIPFAGPRSSTKTQETSSSQSEEVGIPFKPNKPVGMGETIGRGVSSGFLFNQLPQVTALAKASGMLPSGDKAPPAYEMAGPIETAVGAGRLGLEAIAPSVFGDKATKTYAETVA